MKNYPACKELYSEYNGELSSITVLPAKTVLFTTLSWIIIDRSLVYLSYPQDRINTQVIYRFTLAQVGCTFYLTIVNKI